MRKQSMIRKVMSVLCVCALAAGLCSCGTEEKSEEEKILRVVTDGRLYTDVEFAARFLEGVDSGIEVRIQRLPDKQEERENEIQKLRTEIMAGKGPDVYLLENVRENTVEDVMPLLENPYQTMQSGALASLDEFMEKDSYWDDNTYHEEILKEGQYDGRQYIIPMSVMYYVLPRTGDMEEMTGDTLGEWLEQAKNTQDIRIKQAMNMVVQCARWIQPAVDYESGEVLFDQKKWSGFADEIFQFTTDEQESLLQDQHYQVEMPGINLWQEGIDWQVVPDLDGNKLASIMTYGAVGMSSDLKKEAYDFLMLFLNDRTQKFAKENEEIRLPVFEGYLGGAYIPVQESAFEAWMGYPPDEAVQEMQASFNEIDGAYFLTKAERELFEETDEIIIKNLYPDYDWSADIPKVAERAWNTYKMMVSE